MSGAHGDDNAAPKAAYWAMPLFNLVVGWRGHEGSGLENHPMRLWRTPGTVERECPGRGERAVLAAGGHGLVAFEFEGRPAFLEPMPYYREAVAALREGEKRRLVTAVAIGEVCGHDVEALEKWFPIDLHQALAFATGVQVGSPYVEFRDAECRWLERHYTHFGHPVFRRRVHATIDEQIHRGTGELLTRFLSIPIRERTYLRAAMHHAVHGGLSSTAVEDSLSDFFRAFERICKTKDIGAEDLTTDLDKNNRAVVECALRDAADSVQDAARNAQNCGDERQAETLGRIADKVSGAKKSKAKPFGRQLSRLLTCLGLHDEAAADKHFPTCSAPKAPRSWSKAASMYRNAVVHDSYLDAFGEVYEEGDAEDFALHMHDLLIRVLLKLVGYDSTYQPATSMSADTQTLDRVEADAAPRSLGYGQHRL